MLPRPYIADSGIRYFGPPNWFLRRELLPYGIWTCDDGRTVLFNRHYKPIWQRRPDGSVEPADAKEWVPYAKQDWFYSDKDKEPAKRRKAIRALEAWGLPVPTVADVKCYEEPRNRRLYVR